MTNDTSLPWLLRGVLTFFEVVSFSLGLSGLSLKEEQLSAIKEVYEGRA